MENNTSKDLAKENLSKCTDLDIANNLMDLALKTFTVDNFSFYDYSKLIVIQLLTLVNEGILPIERVVNVEAEVRVLLSTLIANTQYKKAKKKTTKKRK